MSAARICSVYIALHCNSFHLIGKMALSDVLVFMNYVFRWTIKNIEWLLLGVSNGNASWRIRVVISLTSADRMLDSIVSICRFTASTAIILFVTCT